MAASSKRSPDLQERQPRDQVVPASTVIEMMVYSFIWLPLLLPPLKPSIFTILTSWRILHKHQKYYKR
jgi:hypothetical protein